MASKTTSRKPMLPPMRSPLRMMISTSVDEVLLAGWRSVFLERADLFGNVGCGIVSRKLMLGSVFSPL